MQQQIAYDVFPPEPRVTIFGVGGAGGNAVARLLARPAPSLPHPSQPDPGLNVICANTDLQALQRFPQAARLQLGRRLTSGFGAGAKPDMGRLAAEESLTEIERSLKGTSVCFIAAGMGGGTGTGAAPVIAQVARALGILTIAVVTKPFAFEGARRARVAEAGSRLLEEKVDALVVVCNEHLIRVAGGDATLRAALAQSDDVVCESASHFALLVAGPAIKRISVADMRSVLAAGGRTVMGFGESHSGADRALRAARSALRNPLLEGVATGARRLIVSVAGGKDLGLFEVDQALAHVREQVFADAEIVWGSLVDPALDGQVRIGIAAAGLPPPGMIAADTRRVSAVPSIVLERGAEQPLLHDGKRHGLVRSRPMPTVTVDRLAFATRPASRIDVLETPLGKRGDRMFRPIERVLGGIDTRSL